MSYTEPPVVNTGDDAVAADWNTYVRDNMRYFKAQLDALTFPTIFQGLILGSDYRWDSTKYVRISKLDYWVYNSAIIVDTLSNPTVDVTASGAGGVDTGSFSGDWFEFYRIRKSSDGTLNTLLHKAKKWSVDQSQTSSASSQPLRKVTSPVTKVGQKFTPATTGYRDFVEVSFQRNASPSAAQNVWVTIEADSGGSPSGTPLATSDYIAPGWLASAVEEKVRFVFRTPVSLTASTAYWIVIQGDYTSSDTNYIDVRYNASGSNTKTYNGSAWSTLSTATIYYKDYVRVESAIVLPSGYDQYTLLSYILGESSTTVRPFQQFNKNVFMLNGGAAANGPASTTPTLTDMSSFLPPVPILARVNPRLTADNTQITFRAGRYGYAVLSTGIPDGPHMTATGPISSGGSFMAGPGEPVFTEYQHGYMLGTGSIYVRGFEF